MWLNKLLPFKKKRGENNPDYVILFGVLFLVVFGLLMLSSASSEIGLNLNNDALFFLKTQILKGVLVGGIFGLILYFIDYKILKKLALPLLIISIILLILIFTPLGVSEKGATRWLDLKIITIQPAEIIKFTFILYLASWLSGKEGVKRKKDIKAGLLPFLIIAGIISALLIKQPATSIVAITMFSALILYFSSGAKMSYIGGVMVLGLLMIIFVTMTTPYRLERVTSYFLSKNQSDEYIRGPGYHLNQALITIGSGGLFGVGYGNSINKTKYLPEPIGDSIFAVIAEEFGFIGTSILIAVFLMIIIRGFILAQKTKDEFIRLTFIGFTSIIGLQTFAHIGSISGVIPMTGVPLPFISYGSTALVVFLSMTGLMLNMSRAV